MFVSTDEKKKIEILILDSKMVSKTNQSSQFMLIVVYFCIVWPACSLVSLFLSTVLQAPLYYCSKCFLGCGLNKKIPQNVFDTFYQMLCCVWMGELGERGKVLSVVMPRQVEPDQNSLTDRWKKTCYYSSDSTGWHQNTDYCSTLCGSVFTCVCEPVCACAVV